MSVESRDNVSRGPVARPGGKSRRKIMFAKSEFTTRASDRRIAMLLLLTAACGFGQVGTGSIRGAITDPSGAVVPSAHVSVKNVQTGVAINLVTDTDGRYVAPTLPIGSYEIQVQAQGFETAVGQNIVLAVGAQRDVNIALAVGQMSQQVAVHESAAAVDTSDSTVSGLIN